MDLHFHLHFSQILHQVVGERIVVVYDQHHVAKLTDRSDKENPKSQSAGFNVLAPALEQFQLRFFEEIVVLQDPNDLE